MSELKTYPDRLAPWEEKKSFQKSVKIDDLEGIKNLMITQHRKAMEQAVIRSTSYQTSDKGQGGAETAEAINQLCNDLSVAIKSLNLGIVSLQATFEWGISEIAWWLELQSKQMREVIHILETPQQTSANERMSWGHNLFRKGEYSDAAKEYQSSLALYPYNPISNISLGIIHLFHLIDKNKALECFINAEKYARGDSAYYTAYALMYQGLAYLDLGDIDSAEKATAKAIDEHQGFGVIYYQNAQYNALLNNKAKSIARLTEAMNHSIGFAFKAETDPLFASCKDEVADFISHKTRSLNNRVLKETSKLDVYLQNGKHLLSGLEDSNLQVENIAPRIKKLSLKDNLLDTLEAVRLLNEACIQHPIFKGKEPKVARLHDKAKRHQSDLKAWKEQGFEEDRKKKSGRNGLVTFALVALLIIFLLIKRGVMDESIFIIILWAIGCWFVAGTFCGIVMWISKMTMNIAWSFKRSKPNKKEQENQGRVDLLEEALVGMKKLDIPEINPIHIPGIKPKQELVDFEPETKSLN